MQSAYYFLTQKDGVSNENLPVVLIVDISIMCLG